jgi:hypothetical protein
LEVYTGMSQNKRPTGHLQVKLDKNGRTRSFWVFWRDRQGRKGGRRLGPAHVRDSGRRTARGAVIWRAGHGTKPGPEFLTPKEAEVRLETILEELRSATEVEQVVERTLQQAVEGWLAERKAERGLKRSTVAGYEDMFERMFRDLGAETPVRSLADGRLRAYFADFKSYRVLSEAKAREALAEGKNVQQLTIERWTAQPPEGRQSRWRRRTRRYGWPTSFRDVEASTARLLSRRPARSATTASNGDDAERRRLDRQASNDKALDACDAGRGADAQHLSGHPRRIARLRYARGMARLEPAGLGQTRE